MSGPPSKDTVTATGYLVVKGTRSRYYTNVPVTGAKIAGSRSKKPTTLGEDEIVVKVKIQLPKQAFEPLEPEALIVVPEELVQHVVTVEATPED